MHTHLHTMKSTSSIRRRRRPLLVTGILGFLALLLSLSAGAGLAVAQPTSDVEFTVTEALPECAALSTSFEGDSLDRDLWSTIVRENPEGYSVEGGDLVMPTTATDIYGTNNTGTPNIILQDLPEGAWQATAQLTVEAYRAYQQAGLIVYGDDDNYAKMVLQGRDTAASNPAARIFQFIREENGAPNEVGFSNTEQLGADYPDTVWVRLTSDGSNLTASYSADGETFTSMPQTKFLAGITDPKIGLIAMSGSVGHPVTEAVFHEFTLATADCPDEPEDTSECPAAGYWKNHLAAWVPTGYSPIQALSTVFSPTGLGTLGSTTLIAALEFGGGPTITDKKKILLRAAVASLLNAAHPDVSYAMGPAQIISAVNSALESNDGITIENLKNQLDTQNNAGCRLA